MSRVHDALRKAQEAPQSARTPSTRAATAPPPALDVPDGSGETPVEVDDASAPATFTTHRDPSVFVDVATDIDELENIISSARETPYSPMKEALLVNPSMPREAPAEEFRTLRTRLNHLQTLQPLHTLVVTSASPAEGKSFTATNLAVTQAQLAEKRVLLADFDFRRPTVDKTFQVPCSPGITDYLLGKASLREILHHVSGTNLYMLTAGEAVSNPLELLNLKECKALIQGLRNHFDWVILDSPPLLFAADGNLLSTMCDGTILVVRIGTTTFDSVSRALQSLCENNVLGVVVNGARRGELYSKYTYYHDYYYAPDGEEPATEAAAETEGHEVAVHQD
jgi:protein-tyrosine kinase